MKFHGGAFNQLDSFAETFQENKTMFLQHAYLKDFLKWESADSTI